MTSFTLQLTPCGGTEHLADLASFRQQSLPIPHSYASWSLHHHLAEWVWVRACRPDGSLLCAFAVALHSSHAIPGMRIGRIEHFGGDLHQAAAPLAGQILAATARHLPRLLRLEVQLFDTDPEHRNQVSRLLCAAGGNPMPEPRSYSHTLRLDLTASTEEVLFKQLSSRMRRNLRKTAREADIHIEPISDNSLTARISRLHNDSFKRHSGSAPALDIPAMIRDSQAGSGSQLLGAFDHRRPAPDHLIAFAWATFHGDHATYEHAASEPVRNASAIAPGAALMWRLILWAREQGASWFDLGGTLPPNSPDDHPLQGIITFKQGFSNDRVKLSSEYVFEPHPFLVGAINQGRRMAGRIRASMSREHFAS
ncbi:MAG TPA: GNAT family N-acetyltransferase [Gammaproteobacteria bacterium]|nr:GNAT family N-acetyltransferase [Gammaproteobacteria bacterium]